MVTDVPSGLASWRSLCSQVWRGKDQGPMWRHCHSDKMADVSMINSPISSRYYTSRLLISCTYHQGFKQRWGHWVPLPEMEKIYNYASSIMAVEKKIIIDEPHWGCVSTNSKPHLVAGIYCTVHLIIPCFSLCHYRATNIKWSLVMTSRRQTVLWSNCTYNHMTSLLGHVVFLHQRAL